MDIGPNLGVPDPAPWGAAPKKTPPAPALAPVIVPVEVDIGKRFEQMLWAEMLSHAGLEDSLTLGGGESASAFSRYVVEAIAEDIAEKHPLGLAGSVNTYAQLEASGGKGGT